MWRFGMRQKRLSLRKRSICICFLVVMMAACVSAFSNIALHGVHRVRSVTLKAGFQRKFSGFPRLRRTPVAQKVFMQQDPTKELPEQEIPQPAKEKALEPHLQVPKPSGDIGWVMPPKERESPLWFAEVGVVMCSALLGIATGTAVAGFKEAIKALRTFTYEGVYADIVRQIVNVGDSVKSQINSITESEPVLNLGFAPGINFEYILFPLLGGIMVSLIQYLYSPNLGPGLKGCIEEIDQGKPINKERFAVKTTAAVATLGTGCSLGPEGPSVEIGVQLSRVIAEAFKFPIDVAHVLVSAGCAAGVAAGFNAPLAAIVFALEIVQPSVVQAQDDRQITRAAAPAVFVSASLSALIAKEILGGGETFQVKSDLLQSLTADHLLEYPVFVGLGVLSGIAAWLFRINMNFFSRFFRGETQFFEWMRDVPQPMKPLMGAAFCGLVASAYPQVLFFGYETLDLILKEETRQTWLDLLTLTGLKLFLTAQALGSGLVGGIFAPSLFIGSTLGAAYEQVLKTTGLAVAGSPTYAMIGASAVLAATFRAPITAIILMFELTQDYTVIAPLMTTAGLAILTIDILEPDVSSPTWSWWWQGNNPPNKEQPFGRQIYSRLREGIIRQVLKNQGDTSIAIRRMDQLEDKGVIRLEELREVVVQMTSKDSAKFDTVEMALKRLEESGVTALGSEEIEAVLVVCFPRAFSADAMMSHLQEPAPSLPPLPSLLVGQSEEAQVTQPGAGAGDKPEGAQTNTRN